MAKSKLPTPEEIEALKSDFISELDTINKAEKEGKSSPKRNFLSSISEDIKSSLDNGTSYVGIKTAIKKIYTVDVSTQIIADFAHNELGIEKRKKVASPSAKGVKNEFFGSDKKESAHDMKKRIANEAPKEGELSLWYI